MNDQELYSSYTDQLFVCTFYGLPIELSRRRLINLEGYREGDFIMSKQMTVQRTQECSSQFEFSFYFKCQRMLPDYSSIVQQKDYKKDSVPLVKILINNCLFRNYILDNREHRFSLTFVQVFLNNFATFLSTVIFQRRRIWSRISLQSTQSLSNFLTGYSKL